MVVVVLQFQSKTVNGTGQKLCTQVGYHDGSCNGMLIMLLTEDCPRQYIIMGRYVCVLLASDNTYDYETLS